MILRSQVILRCAVPLVAGLMVAACDNNNSAQLSGVDRAPPVLAADTTTKINFNITNPTLTVPQTFSVADGDLLTLVWSDEFNAEQLDPNVWFFATGDGSEAGLPSGWGNNELQWYLPDNAKLEDGKLKIEARRETVGEFGYTSARINTHERIAVKYGRIEARMKLPAGQGLWPAFWMLPEDNVYGGFAASGEIDIVEAINLDGNPGPAGFGGGNEIFGTIHFGGEFPANESASVRYTPSEDITEGFHTYAVEWSEFEIRWYFNGILYAVQNAWNTQAPGAAYPAPFDQPFYILFNLAVGGNLPGPADASTPFPSTLEVDWVRVYSGEQAADDGGNNNNSGGNTVEVFVYAADPTVAETLAPPGFDNFGSGAVFNAEFAGDADFNPALQITSGEGYGEGVHVGFVAFTGYDTGFAASYETLNFKVKGDAANLAAFEVKFFAPDTTNTYDLTGTGGVATPLDNGWIQVAIPMSDFAANIAANDGFLLGPLGGQSDAFSYLLTDISFSGEVSNGGADAGITPEAVVYATDPAVTEDLAPPGFDNFGSGAVFNGEFAGDADFNPAFQVTSGEGYGEGVHVGFVAFTGYAAGFAASYETFQFKIKANADNLTSFEVKFIAPPDTSMLYDLTTYTGVTDLGNGWLQASIPMSDFAATINDNTGFLIGPAGGQAAPFSYLLTDIGFSGTAGNSN